MHRFRAITVIGVHEDGLRQVVIKDNLITKWESRYSSRDVIDSSETKSEYRDQRY